MNLMNEKIKNPPFLAGLILLGISLWAFIWAFDEGGLLNFRYFTNQTVFLSLLTMMLWLTPFKNHLGFRFLAGLTLVNLILTGLTYHFILDIDRPISLQGHLSHTLIPIFYLGYYLRVLPGFKLKRFYAFLIHPFVYLLVFLITGPLTGFYPYWFLDIETHGLPYVLFFTLGLMLPGFSLLSLGLLWLKQTLNSRQIESQR